MIDWNNGMWHLGYIIGVPVLALFTLVCLSVSVYGVVSWCRRGGVDGGFIGGIFGVFGIGLAVLLVVSVWPLDTSFHKYYPVTGKVEKIESRFLAAGKATTQRFVVVLDGKPFAIDDTRATLVQVGDEVRLMCSREYQYAGVAGWACEWGQEP